MGYRVSPYCVIKEIQNFYGDFKKLTALFDPHNNHYKLKIRY